MIYKGYEDPQEKIRAIRIRVLRFSDRNQAHLEKNKLDNTSQKQQVEELWLSEKLFRDEILKYKYSTQVYKKFIQKIRHIDRNILYAKVYFRESSETFSEKITPHLKAEDPEGLKKFNINSNLINFYKAKLERSIRGKSRKIISYVYKRHEEYL